MARSAAREAARWARSRERGPDGESDGESDRGSSWTDVDKGVPPAGLVRATAMPSGFRPDGGTPRREAGKSGDSRRGTGGRATG
ncbi:hypothetical protein GCM10010259_07850 [Streptomyces daghestanicus]|uniref:Uncharacterized protein n=1 Tax=Streptomyces daghestanicus TaxID=66885 RepID=A0ABQ3Q4G6_9ACTN|nr:hypothetical protein GCM10010240_12390 [Streptomyces griseoviridis]GGU19788.1 hypothetical protein GCM10010259_07850 [Streptomyces daghestanicus]GHI32157.1 hypothetical protein Sdagh_38870 [Streptomyces daghestanicus]